MTEPPSFAAVYRAAWNRDAFPWQRRLASKVCTTGWPAVLDLPTGVGKTSALEIALYCLAYKPEMPRRIVLVVDRRIVVDQVSDYARALLAKLHAPKDPTLAAWASQLRARWDAGPGAPPFAVAVLRGGMPRDNDWARYPDQPMIGVSTVDQIGSRLLFRGYGISPRSAPIHAGLVGNDTLILLDEVHLATAFAQTLNSVRARSLDAKRALPSRFHVVEMSATVRSASSAPFSLDDEDRAHPVIAKRLRASKLAALRVVKLTGDDESKKLALLAAEAVKAALELHTGGAHTLAIVVNRVDTARLAHALLGRQDAIDARLLTGRMRPIDRDLLVKEIVRRAGAGRARPALERPLIVVATQCIEAGADLDFDAIVTECASLDALRQRFGRVDRRGDVGTSSAVILARSDLITADSDDPIYGRALHATWSWLTKHATKDVIDFGIDALAAAGTPPLEVLPPQIDAPVLLPAHLELWAQTSPVPVTDPEVALWLHGPDRETPTVQVLWRSPRELSVDPSEDPMLVPERLERCRPSTLESISVPRHVLRRWFEDRQATPLGDVELEREDESGRRTDSDYSVFRWRGVDSEDSGWISLHEVKSGDVLVVPANVGGLAHGSFDPTSKAPALDLGDLAQHRGRGIATLRLHRDALAVWGLPETLLATLPAPSEDDPDAEQRQVDEWLTSLPAQWPGENSSEMLFDAKEWGALRDALTSSRRRINTVRDGAGEYLVVTARSSISAEVEDAVTEDDDSSFRRRAVLLSDHSNDVRAHALRYARSLGFEREISDDLALAAWLHDIGKADPRFQRWLSGTAPRDAELATPSSTSLLAKSARPPGNPRERRQARRRAEYPEGVRHEMLSLAMLEHADVLRAAHDPDLVLHLVASHHGWCRPLPPPVIDPASLDVRLQHASSDHGGHELCARTDHTLARLDSGVASRFWRLVSRYGWWGLAWLEAVIRLADHRASEHAEAP